MKVLDRPANCVAVDHEQRIIQVSDRMRRQKAPLDPLGPFWDMARFANEYRREWCWASALPLRVVEIQDHVGEPDPERGGSARAAVPRRDLDSRRPAERRPLKLLPQILVGLVAVFPQCAGGARSHC